MSTPMISRKRSFSAVGKGDTPIVLSPQTRRSIGLTSDSRQQYQSPLPEVQNEEDIREKKGKRRSRNLTASTGSPFSRASADENTSEAGKLTNDQLASHYVNCIKLSTENKITAKNAFSLHLIDHMNEMLKQRCEGVLNFQMAGGTIFASAKIYASRVDAVHSETYKIMSSLGRGSNEEKGNGDAESANEGDNDEKKLPGKKKKKRSKILESNPSAIRLKQLEVSYQADPLDQYYASVFDVANTSGLLINHLLLCKDGLTVRYHSDVESTLSCNASSKQQKSQCLGSGDANEENITDIDEIQQREYQQGIEDRFSDLSKLYENLKNASISKSVDGFQWDQHYDSHHSDVDIKSLSSQDLVNGDLSHSEATMDEDDEIFPDSIPVDNETFAESVPIAAGDRHEGPSGLDEELITAFELGEYSYFKSGAISTWEGPNHWKMKLHGKVASSVAATEKSNESEQTNKTRKRKRKFYINYRSLDINPEEDGFQHLKKSIILTRRMMTKLKTTKNDRLLPAAGEYSLPDLAKCNLQPIVLINPISFINLKRDGVDVDTEQLGMYNYDNPNDKNNYCPNMEDGDGFDDVDDIPTNFATDYTNAECTASNFPDVNMSQTQSQAQLDLDAMLKGDHLISHPRKVEKISIAYAKKATRIDVRKLKAAMWSVLHDETGEKSVVHKNNNDMENSEEPDVLCPSTQSNSFSDLYFSQLPGLMPQSMTENLSIPLAFTCLLHLANEKSLSISADGEMADLNIKISQADET